ncbi:MAG: outer membrane beta-barrel protein [Pseudomonadota bacterium]
MGAIKQGTFVTATCAFTIVLSGSVSAAGETAAYSPFEVYGGIFGGATFADRDVSGAPLPPASYDDTFGTLGGLAGVTLRNGDFFYGLEGDFGFVFGSDDVPLSICEQQWCDADWKAHIRGRLGMTAGMFDIFVAGGLAIAELGGSGSDQTVTGFTVGGGLERNITETLNARVEVLYDEFEVDDLSGPGTYQGKWSDITVRGALLFEF